MTQKVTLTVFPSHDEREDPTHFKGKISRTITTVRTIVSSITTAAGRQQSLKFGREILPRPDPNNLAHSS